MYKEYINPDSNNYRISLAKRPLISFYTPSTSHRDRSLRDLALAENGTNSIKTRSHRGRIILTQ